MSRIKGWTKRIDKPGLRVWRNNYNYNTVLYSYSAEIVIEKEKRKGRSGYLFYMVKFVRDRDGRSNSMKRTDNFKTNTRWFATEKEAITEAIKLMKSAPRAGWQRNRTD